MSADSLEKDTKVIDCLVLYKREYYDASTGRLVKAEYYGDQEETISKLRELRKNWKHAWEICQDVRAKIAAL